MAADLAGRGVGGAKTLAWVVVEPTAKAAMARAAKRVRMINHTATKGSLKIFNIVLTVCA